VRNTKACCNQEEKGTDERTRIINITINLEAMIGKTNGMKSIGRSRPRSVARPTGANCIASNLALTSPEPLRRWRRA
jgi:hypothetical protein